MVQFLRILRDFLDLRLFLRDTLLPFGAADAADFLYRKLKKLIYTYSARFFCNLGGRCSGAS